MAIRVLLASSKQGYLQEWENFLQKLYPDKIQPILFDEQNEKNYDDIKYAIVWNPPSKLFDATPNLKYLFNTGAGVDALVNNPKLKSHTKIVRLEDDSFGQKMAEYILYYVASIVRSFNRYAEQQVNNQWQALDLKPKAKYPIGIMGLGAIGAHIAYMLSELGYQVAGWSRTQKAITNIDCYAGPEQLSTFLNRTRVLINVLPLTQKTEGILNAELLSQLQNKAYLINIGRGKHLVEEDLLQLLDQEKLAGAILDVFSTEPLPTDHPFWAHPNVTITPHISGPTDYDHAFEQIISKIMKIENGEEISGLINLQKGY